MNKETTTCTPIGDLPDATRPGSLFTTRGFAMFGWILSMLVCFLFWLQLGETTTEAQFGRTIAIAKWTWIWAIVGALSYIIAIGSYADNDYIKSRRAAAEENATVWGSGFAAAACTFIGFVLSFTLGVAAWCYWSKAATEAKAMDKVLAAAAPTAATLELAARV